MRSLFVVLLVAACAVASGLSVEDADDAALMEIGVDLTHRVDPAPTYVTTRPFGHEDPVMAKFPLLHEIKGIEAQDWSDIQGLLFREPSAAAEANVDMKLDELEAKFNKLDTMPVPSSIAPRGSTLLPSLIKPEIGLRATLPKKLGGPGPRLQQLKNANAVKQAPPPPPPVAPQTPPPPPPKPTAPQAPKAPAAAPAPAPAPAQAAPAAPAPAGAAPGGPAPGPSGAPRPAGPPQPPAALTADQQKAADAAAKKSTDRVRDTVQTIRMIEKRMKGLSGLIERLKTQIGLNTKDTTTSAQRLSSALNKHRKDQADLAKRMAARKTSLMEVAQHTDSEAQSDADAEVESEADTAEQVANEIAAQLESHHAAEGEADAETETETDSQSELDADAEAVDEIIDSLM